MTTFWACMTCPASGEGDRAAEQHVKGTRHAVHTSASPIRCRAVSRGDGYTLRCCLVIGHDGEHYADAIEEDA